MTLTVNRSTSLVALYIMHFQNGPGEEEFNEEQKVKARTSYIFYCCGNWQYIYFWFFVIIFLE